MERLESKSDRRRREKKTGSNELLNKTIPIISISLNVDRKGYLSRLIKSIDYPVDRVLIQIGNHDSTVIERIIGSIKNASLSNPRLSIELSTVAYNPGSANGFNLGIRSLLLENRSPANTTNLIMIQGGSIVTFGAASTTSPPLTAGPASAPWVLVVNGDIAFYPGILQRISRHTERQLARNKHFALGFTTLCCGSEWSAVVFTRQVAVKVGLMDENYYPAYYEDDDYAIRVHHSGLQAVRFNNTPLLHGDIDGSKDYLSGVFANLYLSPGAKSDPAVKAWRRMHETGIRYSQSYFQRKWGVNLKDKRVKFDCKSVSAINGDCRTTFSRPFNESGYSLSHWELDPVMRAAIVKSGG
jgi:hypothetical protein